MAESFDAALLNRLNEACKHIEWLTRYVKVSESGDSAGVVLNAREFLLQPDILAMRGARERIEAAQQLVRDKMKLTQ